MKKILLLSLVIASVALISCKKKKASGPLVPLPAYSIPNMQGGMCTPKDIAGKPAIVEIWSLRCPHCRTQAKYLEELAKDLDFSKYAIVSIHSRGGERVKTRVAEHFKNKKIQVCLDNGAYVRSLKKIKDFPKQYQVRGIPHLYMVNSKGQITKVLRGARRASALKKELSSLD